MLEITAGAAGGFCGRQFALWGADVVLAEGPQGSQARRLGPIWRHARREGSASFAYLAAGKRSLALADLHSAIDRLAGVDVLITDDGDALFGQLGSSAATLRASLPNLVIIMISTFGHDGPRAGRRATALQLEALSGYLSLNGPTDGPPIAAPGRISDHAVGVSAFVGGLAALTSRARGAGGDLVDVSAFETVCGLVPYLREQHLLEPSQREGGTPEGARLLPCLDGYLSVAISLPHQEAAFREVLGVAADPDGRSLLKGERRGAYARAWAVYSRHSVHMKVDALAADLEARGVVCGIVRSLLEVLDDKQLQSRGFFGALDRPDLGAWPIAGRAARISGAAPFDLSPAPELHSTPMSALHWGARSARSASSDRTVAPLAGLCVLDLTQAWIGPMVGVLLADLGAEVIKIEGVKRPDVWRHVGQAAVSGGKASVHPLNRSAYFNGVNRNKLGLGLDLSVPDGAALFLELIAGADIVLENFTPRVMPKFGLDFGRLRARNPSLVMTSFSGFGQTGPLADQKANGASIEALAGWDAGHLDDMGRPVLMGGYQADPICGLQMAACTLVAIYRRTLTGEGAHVEGSMMEAAAGYIGDDLVGAALARGGAAIGRDRRLSFILPCQGDDRWITLSLEDEADWVRLLGAIGAQAALQDPRFASTVGRSHAAPALRDALAGWTRALDADGVADALTRAGLAAAAMRRPMEALTDPQLEARGWFYSLEAPGLGWDRYPGSWFRYDAAPLASPRRAPQLGEDTLAVLERRLSRTAGNLDALLEASVIGASLS